MRLVSVIVRACRAQRLLKIGCGLAYSALWLAEAAGPEATVNTVERSPEHARLAHECIAAAGHSGRIRVHVGEAGEILTRLRGPYDFVYDDAWFIEEPAYFDAMLNLMRPGALLAMANWFPLEDAILGRRAVEWTTVSGPQWADRLQAYGRRLASHPELRLSYSLHPWLGLAVKTA